jgi:hypothetical protein
MKTLGRARFWLTNQEASSPISGLYRLSCVAILRSMLKARFFVAPVLLLICSGALSFASPKPQPNAEQNEFFESKIRPLLSSKCFACHGSEIQMAKLNMATAANFFKGGESGPVVVKGEPENSRLISVVNYQGQSKCTHREAEGR